MSDQSSLLRQWKLVKLLSARRLGVSVREAADEFEVSQKTIRRDLDTFRELGFPIEHTEEPHGRKRWKIRPDWTEPQANFTFDEAIALFVSRRFLEPLAGTIFWRAAQNAFGKIRASLRPEVIDYIDRMLDRLHQTEVGHGDYAWQAELIDRLMIGIEESRAVFITYQSQQATEPVTYDVYPYGLAWHRGSLYLVGFAPQHDEVRHWKVDRVEDAHLEDVRFQRPADFDLREHLAGSFGIYHGHSDVLVAVRFAPSASRYVRESRWHASQQLDPLPDGSLLAELRLSDTLEIKRWIMSFGTAAEVVKPEVLREEIQKELKAILARYEPQKKPRAAEPRMGDSLR